MFTAWTSRRTQTTLGAIVATLIGLTHSACGDGSTSGDIGKRAGGTYISVAEGQHGNLVVIDGTKITYLSLTASEKKKCAMLTKAFADIDSDSIVGGGQSAEGMYSLESTGTIVNENTSVIWDDDNGSDGSGSKAGSGTLSVQPDMITLEYIFHKGTENDMLVPRDSDQGKAALARYCG
ncbi:hypothetical protein [Amycolatopsis sp. TNS106]|uniref:hypothetical protein n=1 Tax=Amycolatopsis sp. TNS106 TaxID=2861750 RepID=UPI001C55DE5A|nr:hypothetical protein [Amycolatopsis sp. TNS106]QXV57535.1 hypothetical protein CVV72_11355 [Amycolatopsis sp. TNS106]